MLVKSYYIKDSSKYANSQAEKANSRHKQKNHVAIRLNPFNGNQSRENDCQA